MWFQSVTTSSVFSIIGEPDQILTGFGEFLYEPDWLDMEDAERAVTFFYHLSLCALNTSLVSGAMAERSPSVPSKHPQGELQDLPGVLGLQRDHLCHPCFLALQSGRLAEATWRNWLWLWGSWSNSFQFLKNLSSSNLSFALNRWCIWLVGSLLWLSPCTLDPGNTTRDEQNPTLFETGPFFSISMVSGLDSSTAQRQWSWETQHFA